MAYKIFGLQFGRNKEPELPDPQQLPSIVPPDNDEGATIVLAGGAQVAGIDMDHAVRTEAELIARYRDISLHPEVEAAIEDIVNQAIITDDVDAPPVAIDLSKLEVPEGVKNIIEEEFAYIIRLLNFNNKAYEIFKNWYVDGRLNYHVIVDEKHPEWGVLGLRSINPLNLRKVREVTKVPDESGFLVTEIVNEYYVYSELGFNRSSAPYSNVSVSSNPAGYVKIAKDAIVNATSGLQDAVTNMVLSYLHSAIKPLNQLRMLEDAAIIYRLVRAPERRVFYLDVGGLPRAKAEQYLNEMMRKHKNKVVYDQATGEVKDNRKFMTMLEDYWLPRRDGKGTEIDILPGGENLGEMTDVEYFKRKLYEALKVPMSRLEASSPFSMGRPSEITRDELKFMKFVERLRLQFSQLFFKILRTQLMLKRVVGPDEWEEISPFIKFRFADDNFFEELKQSDVMRDRAQTATLMEPFVGVYFSRMWMWRQVWRLTEEEIEEIVAELNQEALEMAKQQKQLNKAADPEGTYGGFQRGQ
jgi:hypothetical protein